MGGLVSRLPRTHRQDDVLYRATLENTQPYVPPLRSGRVVNVYDGDSLTVVTVIHGTAYNVRLRLRGIDAPEIRSKCAQEKAAAHAAREALAALASDRIVRISNVSLDKYGGRYVATVHVGAIDCSEHMVRRGLARTYNGGTKYK